jgi:hypothetical protein
VNVIVEIWPGLALTLATGTVLFILIYLTSPRSRPEYVFTYMVFSVMAYLVTSLLRDVQITLGFSFGLLAVFTLLRYRTDVIPIREMTFLYVAITLPFMNSLFMATRVSFEELALLNGGIAAFILIIDRAVLVYYGLAQIVFYEKIDLIRNDNREALLADLRERLGVEIKGFVVEEVDFMRDTARLTVYYRHGGSKQRHQV